MPVPSDASIPMPKSKGPAAATGNSMLSFNCRGRPGVKRKETKRKRIINFKHATSRTASSVKQPVSRLDGVVNRVGTRGIVHLPQPKAHLGHLVAVIQRDNGDVGRHGSEEAAAGNVVCYEDRGGGSSGCSSCKPRGGLRGRRGKGSE